MALVAGSAEKTYFTIKLQRKYIFMVDIKQINLIKATLPTIAHYCTNNSPLFRQQYPTTLPTLAHYFDSSNPLLHQ